MASKIVKVEITGDPAGFERSMTVVSESAGKAAGRAEDAMTRSSSRIGGAFGKLDGLLGGFGIPFTGALSEIGAKFDEMETHGSGAFKKISAAGGLALGATALAVAGIGLEGVHLADQFEKVHANLETAVKNTGGSMKQLDPILDEQASKFAKLGYNQTEYQGALAAGVLATGSSQKALGLMSHAADLAAFSHTSLEKATIALAKASEGNLRPLKQLGIDLPIHAANAAQVDTATKKLADAQDKLNVATQRVSDTTGKEQVSAYKAFLKAQQDVTKAQDDLNQKTSAGGDILDAVNKKTEGASAKAAETFQGKIKGLTAELENMGIKIGLFLIPIIEDLVTAISDVVDWFEKHQAVAIALAGVIATVLGAAIAVFVYDKVSSFVSGVGRMIDGLTNLITKSGETAAAVEADSAAMATAAETSGAAVGAEGAGAGAAAGGATAAGAGEGAAVGGEAAALGEGAAAGGIGLTAFAAGAALVVGVGAGLARTVGLVKDETLTLDFSVGNLASQSIPQLSSKFSKLSDDAGVMNKVLDENNAKTLATKTMHDQFNKILEQSPQFASKFIAGVQGAGQSTDWYNKKLQEHVDASENAKLAQERYSLQLQIADAKARGDAGAVYGLTLQLNAVPKDVHTNITNTAGQALSDAEALRRAIDDIPKYVPITFAVTAEQYGDFQNVPHFSDRNLKYNIVPVS